MDHADIPHPTLPRFRFRPEKAAEAIEVIARAKPGLTQYFVGKILYLADKAHVIDWGRPITFDRYVAMEHGPVPSATRNMLLAAAGSGAGMREDLQDVAQRHAVELSKHVRVELEMRRNGERQHVYPVSAPSERRSLSATDQECLDAAIRKGSAMDFAGLRDRTHQDEAWSEAWRRGNGRVADIDITLWAAPELRPALRRQLSEYGSTY